MVASLLVDCPAILWQIHLAKSALTFPLWLAKAKTYFYKLFVLIATCNVCTVHNFV